MTFDACFIVAPLGFVGGYLLGRWLASLRKALHATAKAFKESELSTNACAKCSLLVSAETTRFHTGQYFHPWCKP